MRYRVKLCVGICFFLLLLSGCKEKEEHYEGTLTVSFITVGKGDAFLIETPNKKFYMWDTGKKEDKEQISAVLQKKGVKELEGIFLSHGHKDHAGNLEMLLQEYSVKKLYLSGKDDASYKKIDAKALAKEYDVSVTELAGGEKLALGGATGEIWLPDKTDYENENNNSVVMRLVYGDTACLFTGDMEKEEEAEFLSENRKISANILKLGHHGEDDATSPALLKRVKPEYGIITGNAEENPESVNTQTQENLEKYGVKPYYSEGTQLGIDFILDGKEVNVCFIENERGGNMKEIFNMINQKPEPMTILISLVAALILSVILYGAYRLANTKESYQPQFAVTLVIMALISTVLMDLIQSNLALSLGMLGSLSIVRFRTNIKDTRDIGFIFWSMAIGLAAATQSYFIGAVGSLVLACVLIGTKKRAAKQAAMLMVIRGSHTDLDKMQELVKERTESVKVRAKNILSESFEIVYEVRLQEERGNQIIEEIFGMGGIDSVNLLAQNS